MYPACPVTENGPDCRIARNRDADHPGRVQALRQDYFSCLVVAPIRVEHEVELFLLGELD